MSIVASEDLRCDVSWRSAIRNRLLIDLLEALCKTEVHKLEMAALRHLYHDILRLQVSINDIVRVQILQRKKNFRRIIRHISLHCRVVLPDLAQEGASLDIL